MTLRNRRSAYGALMDAVVVTPELEQRLLEAVTRRANRRPAVPAWRWLRLAALASAVCCVVLMVWSSYGVPPVTTTPPAVVQGGYGPVVYDDLQALTAALSYPLRIPAALPEGYELSLVQSLPGELAELRWSDGTDTLCYRMAPGAGGLPGGRRPDRGGGVVGGGVQLLRHLRCGPHPGGLGRPGGERRPRVKQK